MLQVRKKACLYLLPADRSDQDVLCFQSSIKACSPCGLPPLGQILLSSLFFLVITSVSEKEISFLGPVPASEMGLRGRDAQHAWKSIVKYFAAPQPEWSLCSLFVPALTDGVTDPRGGWMIF